MRQTGKPAGVNASLENSRSSEEAATVEQLTCRVGELERELADKERAAVEAREKHANSVHLPPSVIAQTIQRAEAAESQVMILQKEIEHLRSLNSFGLGGGVGGAHKAGLKGTMGRMSAAGDGMFDAKIREAVEKATDAQMKKEEAEGKAQELQHQVNDLRERLKRVKGESSDIVANNTNNHASDAEMLRHLLQQEKERAKVAETALRELKARNDASRMSAGRAEEDGSQTAILETMKSRVLDLERALASSGVRVPGYGDMHVVVPDVHAEQRAEAMERELERVRSQMKETTWNLAQSEKEIEVLKADLALIASDSDDK